MKLQEFLDFLSEGSEKELVFQFGEDEIRKDYHITEILSSRVSAIDCGGKVDVWDETILQLLEPSQGSGERFMSSEKALDILDKSFKKIELHKNSNLILEFRPQDSVAAQRYNPSAIYEEGSKLIVVSEGSTTQCKAAIRSSPDGVDTCCGPKIGRKSSTSSCCG